MARKILLADDSVTAQNMGRKILADAGYEVITVNNGSAALKKIAEIKPDLIVLDVYMPGYSGLEVCQRVKDSPDTSRTPVLLTVGKLEPFKPEEARRVRAEGFIVKPFEASELLSALSKLEDKIVPRGGEASKSGRFARAIAAVEENSKYDRNAGADEDSGWKSRIGFPVKKKAPEPEPESNDSEIYNAMNRDLRTVVEPESTPKPLEVTQEVAAAPADRVDLSALAAPGLPKDVTSEEIAALLAAAAQVKSKTAETAESANVVSAPAAPAQAAPYTGPERRAEKIAEREGAKREAVASKNVEAEAPAEVAGAQPAVEKVDTPAQKSVENEKATAVPSPTTAEVMEAIASVERADVVEPVAQELGSQNVAVQSVAVQNAESQNTGLQSTTSQNANEEPVDLPVTMAVGVGASAGSSEAPRWMAIPVAAEAEETSISLEQEMQKAQASAAAQSIQVESLASVPEVSPIASVHAISVAIEAPSAPTSPAPVAQVEPSPSQPLELPSAATEVTPTVVKEFETVAAAHVQVAPVPVEPSAAVTRLTEPETQPVTVIPQAAEARTEEISPSPSENKIEAQVETSSPESKTPEVIEPKNPEPAAATVIAQDVPATVEEVFEIGKSEVEAQLSATESPVSKSFADETSAHESSEGKALPTESLAEESPAKFSAGAVALREPIPGGEMAKKESEIAATTAAAWANWRQIRETGDPRGKSPEAAKSSQPEVEDDEESDVPRDAAAMAVAAGAENRPTEATEEAADPDAIASIVDSVLAQMRPKIVEEISRKMGKKK